jgi:hypothetical protein
MSNYDIVNYLGYTKKQRYQEKKQLLLLLKEIVHGKLSVFNRQKRRDKLVHYGA